MEYATSPNPVFLNSLLSSCSATPCDTALMKRLHDGTISSGVLSASAADANRISCFAEGWNLLKRSFFFDSFSLWNVNELLWVSWRSSSTLVWRLIAALMTLKTSGGCPWGGWSAAKATQGVVEFVIVAW